MRLISCHIENFGKLQDFSWDFEEGYNPICEKNGWGKSTLATFIRVMLFGFQNETKRDAFENERKKYAPWQKGVYGGELCLEVNNVKYSVRRVFGSKATEDEFELTNLSTNLPSSDYSDKIGEEIFKIDGPSFERTVFLSQNDCGYDITDGINAKIGNLAENTDDINNFEAADKTLKDLLNSMIPTKKTGSLNKLKGRITEIDGQIRGGAHLEAAIDEIEKKRKHCLEQKDEIISAQNMLKSKQTRVGQYKDLAARREKYDELQKNYRERLTELNEAGRYFPGEVPTEAEINRQLEICAEAAETKNSVEIYTLSPEEKMELEKLSETYGTKMISDEEFHEKSLLAQDMVKMRVELGKYTLTDEEESHIERVEKLFEGEVPEEARISGIISRHKACSEKETLLKVKELTLQTKENLVKQKYAEDKRTMRAGMLRNVLVILGIIALIAGGVVGYILDIVPGTVIFCGGLVLLIIGFILGFSSGRYEPDNNIIEEFENLVEEIEADKESITSSRQAVDEFCEKYGITEDLGDIVQQMEEMLAEIKDYNNLLRKKVNPQKKAVQERLREIVDELNSFLIKYNKPNTVNDYPSALNSIKNEQNRYIELNRKQSEAEKYRIKYEQLAASVKKYVADLQIEPQENTQKQLMELKLKLGDIERKKTEFARAEEAKNRFEENEDIDRLMALKVSDTEESLEQMSEQMGEYADRLDRLNRDIQSYNIQLNDLGEQLDMLAELEAEKAELQEKFNLEKADYDLLVKTREILGEAKSSFTAKYTAPVMEAFKKYYGMLAGEDVDKLTIDANTKLSVIEYNIQRDVAFQSMGKKDLIGICMRMALIEVMYKDEKPFIIMDDPFVNLDNARTTGGMRFIKEISKEYQLVYFTCHSSRAV